MIEEIPHDCEGEDCELCEAYWAAYSQEEDDEKDRQINWRDYV